MPDFDGAANVADFTTESVADVDRVLASLGAPAIFYRRFPPRLLTQVETPIDLGPRDAVVPPPALPPASTDRFTEAADRARSPLNASRAPQQLQFSTIQQSQTGRSSACDASVKTYPIEQLFQLL